MVKGKRSFHASEKLRYAVLIDDLVFLFFTGAWISVTNVRETNIFFRTNGIVASFVRI